MAEARPSLSHTATGNTTYYSIASNASTMQPAEMSAALTKIIRASTNSDPSPAYAHAANGTGAPSTDIKAPPTHEKHPAEPADESSKKKFGSLTTAPTELGTSGGNVVIPTSPSRLNREEQLNLHAVGTFAGGAVTAVNCGLRLHQSHHQSH